MMSKLVHPARARRPRTRVGRWGPAGLVLFMPACTLLVDTSGLSTDSAVAIDASIDGSVVAEGAAAGDVITIGDGANACLPVRVALAAPVLIGNAMASAESAIQLTSDTKSQAGAATWTGTFDFASFDVSFDASMTRPVKSSVGNGFSIFWRTVSSFPPQCVAAGSRSCLFGDADGYAGVLRTSYTPSTATPFAGIYRATADPGQDAPQAGSSASFTFEKLFTVDATLGAGALATTPPPPSSWHAVVLAVRGERARVRLDGVPLADIVLPAGPARVMGGLAIAAGTGDTTARQCIRSAALTVYGPSCSEL